MTCVGWLLLLVLFPAVRRTLSGRMEAKRREQKRPGMEGWRLMMLESSSPLPPKSSHIPVLSWFDYEIQWIPPLPKQVSVDLGLWHHPWVIWIIPTWLILGQTFLSAMHQMCGFGIRESNLQRIKLIWGHFFHPEHQMETTRSRRELF